MKLLDRGEQRNLLLDLAERYPNPLVEAFDPGDLENSRSVNLHYLAEHGLVSLSKRERRGIPVQGFPAGLARFHGPDVTGDATITARGMDFLQDDGGLTAILDTLTVRLHADTIRDLVEAKILASDAPEPEKHRLIDSLRKLPEEGLKTLTDRLINEGLSNAPGAWQALIQMLS